MRAPSTLAPAPQPVAAAAVAVCGARAAMAELVSELVAKNRVMVFSKTYCPYCTKAKQALGSVGLTQYGLLELDGHARGDEARRGVCARRVRAGGHAASQPGLCKRRRPGAWPAARARASRSRCARRSRAQVQDALLQLTGARSVPRVFVDGKCIGGGDDTAAMARDGRLKAMLTTAGIM